MSARKRTSSTYGLDPSLFSSLVSERPNQPGQPEPIGEEAREWLRKRAAHVKAGKRYVTALNAICSKRKGMEHPAIREFLTCLACLAVTRGRVTRKSWERVWTVGTGKTWKALREFPDRMCRMADELKRINESWGFSPARFVTAKTTRAEIARQRFHELPGILTVYAEGLRRHVARVPRWMAEGFPPSPRSHTGTLWYLSGAVRGATGKFRDREVAELLNAAALALDEKAEFDALTIAQGRSRHRRTLKS